MSENITMFRALTKIEYKYTKKQSMPIILASGGILCREFTATDSTTTFFFEGVVPPFYAEDAFDDMVKAFNAFRAETGESIYDLASNPMCFQHFCRTNPELKLHEGLDEVYGFRMDVGDNIYLVVLSTGKKNQRRSLY